jgi:N-acyl-D-amino-acid deacylase
MKLLSRSLLLLGCSLSVAAADVYDLVIRNGRIIDGAGNPAFFADLGIRDGKVAAIGRISGQGEREIDATGMVVAPGFIDVHTHAENIDRHPHAENFLRMGVTTLILGNCGTSRVDLGAYFARLEEMGISPNVASLIGHGSVRSQVVSGSVDRAPTEEELEQMKELVDQAMRDGAVGFSTGLIYLPGTFARTEELIALAKAASAHDGIYVSHMRNEGRAIFSALEELIQIAREANIRAQVSHIKLSGNIAWGQADKVLERIEAARAEGLDITQDQYMYTASSTGISQLVPRDAREGGRDEFRQRIADPDRKREIALQMIQSLQSTGRNDYSYAAIASYRTDPSLNGLRIPEAARRKFGSDDLEAQIALIMEIESNGGASGVFHGMDEDDLQIFLRHPNTMFASDSSVRPFGEGVPHPRGYGNSARVLARYVRDLNVLPLEDAIRKMTSLPAASFRLKGRGQLVEGHWADVVVFDPAAVQDHATYDDPHQYATGFRYVLVNGEVTVDNDEHTEARAGQIVRHQRL